MRLHCVKKSDSVLRIESADCPVLAHWSHSLSVANVPVGDVHWNWKVFKSFPYNRHSVTPQSADALAVGSIVLLGIF
jgi:hypothetical protein